jgi:hypothetical protein
MHMKRIIPGEVCGFLEEGQEIVNIALPAVRALAPEMPLIL